MKLFPSCKEASRLQSEALDHELPFLQKLGLRFHLFACKWCRRYGQQISLLRTVCRRCDDHAGDSPAQKLSPKARERMKRALQSPP